MMVRAEIIKQATEASVWSENIKTVTVSILNEITNELGFIKIALCEWWNNINFINDFLTPILLSIIAAFIFWIFFNLLPEHFRKKNVRRTIEANIYNILTQLFSIIEIPFRPNSYSVSNVQHKIYAGQITEEDFSIALQNKCLNETYLIDENADKFICIGKKLEESIKKLDEKIEKLFSFSYYLTPEEISILEVIRSKLSIYEYNDNAKSVIGKIPLYPVVPNMAYMAHNFFEVYQLYLKLLNLVYENDYECREMCLTFIIMHYNKGEYKKVMKYIKQKKEKFQENIFVDIYTMLCSYKLKNCKKFLKVAEDLLRNKINLVSSRTSIMQVYNCDKFQNLLKKYYSPQEISQFVRAYEDEENRYSSIMEINKQLRLYYEKKIK